MGVGGDPEAKCFSFQSQCFRLEEWKAERKHNQKQLSLIIPRAKCHLLIAANTIDKIMIILGKKGSCLQEESDDKIDLTSWETWNYSHKSVSYVSVAEMGVEERAGKLLAWLLFCLTDRITQTQTQTDKQTDRRKERSYIFPLPLLSMPKTWFIFKIDKIEVVTYLKSLT